MIAKDRTERLSAVALSIGLINSARLMRVGSRGPSESFFSDTPPKCLDQDWVGRRRLGNVYRSVREKQEIVRGNCYLSATCFTNSDISGCCFNSNSREKPPADRKFKSQTRIRFSLWKKKNSSPRELRKWSLGLGHNLKALGLTCVRSQSSREINNATKSEFSTFLKINKPRIQFLLRLTRFYPIYG